VDTLRLSVSFCKGKKRWGVSDKAGSGAAMDYRRTVIRQEKRGSKSLVKDAKKQQGENLPWSNEGGKTPLKQKTVS